MKHAAKYFGWIDNANSACCAISEKPVNAEKLRAELNSSEYGKVEGICAHVPTRFGSRHLVLCDVVDSREAIVKLAAVFTVIADSSLSSR